MTQQYSSHQPRKRHRHPIKNQYQPISLDPEVLSPDRVEDGMPHPSCSLRRVGCGRVGKGRVGLWDSWDESDIDGDWEDIPRRGNRKPSLDDYDRWQQEVYVLTGERPRRHDYLGRMVSL